MPTSLRVAWIRHPRVRAFIISVIIGIGLEAALHLVPKIHLVSAIGDRLADSLIGLSLATSSRINAPFAFVLIDIDDATWHRPDWNTPLVTPRDAIRDLLQRVAPSRAAAIIVDVDLAFGDGNAKPLKDFLQAYPANAPSLILMRSLISPDPAGPTIYPAPRGTDYDAATKDHPKDHPNIYWAVPLFQRDPDGMIRRWKLAAIACQTGPASETGVPIAIPSAELIAALIARQVTLPAAGSAPIPLDSLLGKLARLLPDNCTSAAPDPGPIVLDGYLPPIVIKSDDISNRVLYTVRWQNGAIALGPVVPLDGVEVPLVSVRPARTVLALPADGTMSGLDGRIVVIGGSFADSGDWHGTEVGLMPGALVVINAIEALAQRGTPREPCRPERLAMSLGIILLVAGFVAVLRPIVALLCSGLLVFGILVASIPSVQSGVLLDLSVPATGILFHHLREFLGPMRRGWRDMRRMGLRWLLRPQEEVGMKRGRRSP